VLPLFFRAVKFDALDHLKNNNHALNLNKSNEQILKSKEILQLII